MLNDFFSWNMGAYRPADAPPPLRALDRERFFELFKHAGLPDTAMNAEMADGYLMGCVAGPEPMMVYEWMEDIFGQAHLPICADPALQDELLGLLLRRHQQISDALPKGVASITLDNMLIPLAPRPDSQEWIKPYQLNARGQREGVWQYKDWATGFGLAMSKDPAWGELIDDDSISEVINPILFYELGYNADYLALQIDDSAELQALLFVVPYKCYAYWRDARRQRSAKNDARLQPYARETAKTGRNDPCPCGSGKKHKKCCGA
jgi:uncharacterized protein